MSIMFEVYYHAPEDTSREAALTANIISHGGRLDNREVGGELLQGVCLTYEFDDRGIAEEVATALRSQGIHVEGPVDYAQ